jgi:hypothetical protein
LIRKIVKKAAAVVLRKKGYSQYMAAEFFDLLMDDLFKNKNITLGEKIWAYRHGFFGDKVHEYNLSEANYQDYFPDFSYYKLHPINGRYSRWIDDKVTFRYIFQQYKDYLPKYYFELRNNGVCRLVDCPDQLSADIESVICLLNKEKELAVKLIEGTGGVGVYKISSSNGGGYLINKKPVSRQEMEQFLSSLDQYAVMEYIHAHQDILKFYKEAPNALRLEILHDINTTPEIVCAFIRIGTEKSGMVDNVRAGGMCAGINIETGKLFKPIVYLNKMPREQAAHPDTGIKIEGEKIPHWHFIKEKLYEIFTSYPQLLFFGIDIVVTESGFKIIEINSHPDSAQIYYPVMENERLKNFFLKESGCPV